MSTSTAPTSVPHRTTSESSRTPSALTAHAEPATNTTPSVPPTSSQYLPSRLPSEPALEGSKIFCSASTHNNAMSPTVKLMSAATSGCRVAAETRPLTPTCAAPAAPAASASSRNGNDTEPSPLRPLDPTQTATTARSAATTRHAVTGTLPPGPNPTLSTSRPIPV